MTTRDDLYALVDIEAIRQLKYRYYRLLDLKRWEDLAATFTEDASFDYGDLSFATPAEATAYFREHLGPRMITMHHGHHPEICVTGDEATGVWALEDKVLMPDLNLVLEGAAVYSDRYRRTPDGWRIAHTGYLRTYEVTFLMDSLPGYTLKIGGAYVDDA